MAKELKGLGLLAVVSGELLGCTGVGIGVGYWLWSKWGAPWWVLLLLTMGGLALAFYRIYRISLALEDRK